MDFIRMRVRGVCVPQLEGMEMPSAGLTETCAQAWEGRQLAHG